MAVLYRNSEPNQPRSELQRLEPSSFDSSKVTSFSCDPIDETVGLQGSFKGTIRNVTGMLYIFAFGFSEGNQPVSLSKCNDFSRISCSRLKLEQFADSNSNFVLPQ